MENQGNRYDRIAKDFAAMRTEFYKEQKYIDAFIGYLVPQSSVLDVGCGSGCPIAAYLMEKGFEVTGIDGSRELLNIAKAQYPQLKTIYGDIRTISLKKQYDAIIEWWCLFHLPKPDQLEMIRRFRQWVKPHGIIEFTTGDQDFEGKNSDMLGQELYFFSHDPSVYEKTLKKNGFRILLKESDQPEHLVWIVRYVD